MLPSSGVDPGPDCHYLGILTQDLARKCCQYALLCVCYRRVILWKNIAKQKKAVRRLIVEGGRGGGGLLLLAVVYVVFGVLLSLLNNVVLLQNFLPLLDVLCICKCVRLLTPRPIVVNIQPCSEILNLLRLFLYFVNWGLSDCGLGPRYVKLSWTENHYIRQLTLHVRLSR
jgi:hypothetical protein